MKILKFNELAGNTYKSIMAKVADKGDPRSFRLYDDAKKLRSKFYSKEPLKILLKTSWDSKDTIDFKIDNITFPGPNPSEDVLRISSIIDGKEHLLCFSLRNNVFKYQGIEPAVTAYVDRKGANIISRILKDYDVEVRPQDIPQY